MTNHINKFTVSRTVIILSVLTFLLWTTTITVAAFPGNTSDISNSEKIPRVYGVLFYSPSCGHCEMVINEVLPPIMEQYQDQVVLLGVNITVPNGQNFFLKTLEYFNIPDNQRAVPFLVIGENVLIGSQEIPEQLPEIIEDGLNTGGIGWPEIPGIEDIIEAQQENIPSQGEQTATEPPSPLIKSPEITSAPASEQQLPIILSERNTSIFNKFNQDPVANSIAVVVLIFMGISVVFSVYRYLDESDKKIINLPSLTIPLLSFIGVGIAGYLSYIEITQSVAVCGPVGNCNAVQQSPYATVFGFLPVGILGIFGYILILSAWFINQFGPVKFQKIAAYTLWGMAWFGFLFSLYLTFLEPFVIGATCAWCITSSILITFVFLASTDIVRET